MYIHVISTMPLKIQANVGSMVLDVITVELAWNKVLVSNRCTSCLLFSIVMENNGFGLLRWHANLSALRTRLMPLYPRQMQMVVFTSMY